MKTTTLKVVDLVPVDGNKKYNSAVANSKIGRVFFICILWVNSIKLNYTIYLRDAWITFKRRKRGYR